MTREHYQKSIESQIERVRSTLTIKNKEYAPEDDPLHNFKASAAAAQTTPEHAAFMFMLKHFTSVADMIKHGNPKDYSFDLWKEKLGDMKNYLFLIEAIIEEKVNESIDV